MYRRRTPIRMPPALMSGSSDYLTALTHEIEKKLQRLRPRRGGICCSLFADVALEVDDRARGGKILLQYQKIILESPYICLYNVPADHFVSTPQSGKPILDLIVQLWSQSFATNIFTLLFHKWVFEVQLDNPETLLCYSSAFVQGLELRITTSTRLKTCLYSFKSPGGLTYPTRAVRHAAWDTLNVLFSVGQYPRHLISFFFRLLYPRYCPPLVGTSLFLAYRLYSILFCG